MTQILVLMLESTAAGPVAPSGAAPSGVAPSGEDSERLFAGLGAVPWALVEGGAVADTGCLEGPADLDGLASRFSQVERVLALVPGTDVVLRRVLVPSRREAEARTAAPFVIEDDLGVDPEDVHVALGPADEAGERLIAIADHQRMAQWRAALAPFTGRSVDLQPETLAFPGRGDGVCLVERDGRVLVILGDPKTGEGSPAGIAATALEPEIRPIILPGLLTGLAPTAPLHVMAEDPAALVGPAGGGRPLEAHAPLDDSAFLARCAGPARAPLSLLQGPYVLRGRWTFQPAQWVRAGALAACIALVLIGIEVSEAARLGSRAETLHRQTEEVFRQAFPDVRRVVNPRAQMNSRLKALGSGTADPFLALTNVFFTGLKTVPAVEVRDLRYYAERGELGASVAYRDYGDLERLKAAVAKTGGRFSEGGSRQQGGRIVGEVTIGLVP